jgi:predicted RNase H-like HicB family nuclease
MSNVYPVVFSPEVEGGFCVYVPDLPGCVTSAETYAEGVEKIRDGICGMLYVLERDKKPTPVASDPAGIEIESEDVIALVDFDLSAYKRRLGSKAVRRTISIPEWMDEMAENSGVSLSQVTQDALRQIFKVS